MSVDACISSSMNEVTLAVYSHHPSAARSHILAMARDEMNGKRPGT